MSSVSLVSIRSGNVQTRARAREDNRSVPKKHFAGGLSRTREQILQTMQVAKTSLPDLLGHRNTREKRKNSLPPLLLLLKSFLCLRASQS
jgi:hypothetical protein